MKRKYFNTKNNFQFLEENKYCFLNKRNRRIKQKTKKAFFSFSPTLSGMHFLIKFLKKKVNMYYKSFFFFKMYMFNNFSCYWGSLGHFFFTNLDFFFLKHFIFFNKTEDLVNIFKQHESEEAEEDLKYLKEACAIQTVFDNKISLEVYSTKIKKITFNIFFNKIKLKKNKKKTLNLFFILFILKKLNNNCFLSIKVKNLKLDFLKILLDIFHLEKKIYLVFFIVKTLAEIKWEKSVLSVKEKSIKV